MISGRVNQVFVSTLDLEVIQTKQTSIRDESSTSNAGFKIKDGVTLQGDSSFEYSFTIPDHPNRLGDYKISVSKDVGSATIIIHAVDDPENFIESDEPLTVETDSDVYEFGDKMTVTGFVKDPYTNSSYDTGAGVHVSISHENGSPLEMVGLPEGGQRLSTSGIVVAYDFRAIPETSGRYSVQIDVSKLIFEEGNYVVKSTYGDEIITTPFTIVDSLNLTDGAIITIDKDVYGLGETVHLTGIIPPTGDNSISISVTRPDGTRTDTGATIENQQFSWDWDVPVYEKPQKLKDDDGVRYTTF